MTESSPGPESPAPESPGPESPAPESPAPESPAPDLPDVITAGVYWRRERPRRPVTSAGVLRFKFSDRTVTLCDHKGGVVFSHVAGDIGVAPLRNRQFKLVVAGQAYVLAGMYSQAAASEGVRRMVSQQHARLLPPPGQGITAQEYLRWVRGSASGMAKARNAAPQQAMWQEFWLRILTQADAQKLPSKVWERTYGQRDGPVRGEPPAHGRATTVASFVWMLVPLLSLGFLTWLAYLYAAVRVRRRRWVWVCALLTLVLDGLYYWLDALVGTGRASSAGGAFAGMMAVLALGGTWGAWHMRTYVFYGWRA